MPTKSEIGERLDALEGRLLQLERRFAELEERVRWLIAAFHKPRGVERR